jgi:hypothetical protein
MKMLWCWRCRAEVPMLTDDEWRRVSALFHKGSGDRPIDRMYSSALVEHERITGRHISNSNVLWDHIQSNYDPACDKCGKPLRTPRAELCGSCMHPRAAA